MEKYRNIDLPKKCYVGSGSGCLGWFTQFEG